MPKRARGAALLSAARARSSTRSASLHSSMEHPARAVVRNSARPASRPSSRPGSRVSSPCRSSNGASNQLRGGTRHQVTVPAKEITSNAMSYRHKTSLSMPPRLTVSSSYPAPSGFLDSSSSVVAASSAPLHDCTKHANVKQPSAGDKFAKKVTRKHSIKPTSAARVTVGASIVPSDQNDLASSSRSASSSNTTKCASSGSTSNPASTSSSVQVTLRPAGAGWRGVDTVSAVHHSMCFALETSVSSVCVASSGDLVLAGFRDGSVRVFEMGSTHRSDSQGCLLGYVGEIGGMRTSLDVKVCLSEDGQYVFAGCRKGGATVTAWDLTSFRTLRKRRGFSTAEGVVFWSHTHAKLKGLGAASTNSSSSFSASGSSSSSYRLACGLGISNLHVWNFTPGYTTGDDPANSGGGDSIDEHASWTLIYDQPTNGNTIRQLALQPGGQKVYSQSNSKPLRCWNLEQPWTKSFYDIPGSGAMLGFEAGRMVQLLEEFDGTASKIDATGVGGGGVALVSAEKGETKGKKKQEQTDQTVLSSAVWGARFKGVGVSTLGDVKEDDSAKGSSGKGNAGKSMRRPRGSRRKKSLSRSHDPSTEIVQVSAISHNKGDAHDDNSCASSDCEEFTLVALSTDGTVWCSNSKAESNDSEESLGPVLTPILKLKGPSDPYLHLSMCEINDSSASSSSPLLVVIDNRGCEGVLNVMRVAPLSYFVSGTGAGMANVSSSKATIADESQCPLCRSTSSIHWEMSRVQSGDDDSSSDSDDSGSDTGESSQVNEHENAAALDVPKKRASSEQHVSGTKRRRKTTSAYPDTTSDSTQQSSSEQVLSMLDNAITSMSRKQLEQTCRRLQREVSEYKSKIRQVCDQADSRFKEEKRLRKNWNKAQAQLQAQVQDAEERAVRSEKQLQTLKAGGDPSMSVSELTSHGKLLLTALQENVKLKDKVIEDLEEPACVICCCETATFAMNPCGHLALCESCTGGMKASRTAGCPICKTPIENYVRIWKP